MLPLYLAGAAALGAGAFLLTRKPKIPPAVAQTAIQSPAPSAPSASTVVTPASPEAQAASEAVIAAAQQAGDLVEAQIAAQEAGRIAATQFPGTGVAQSATQFNPNPGPTLNASSPEVEAAAQAASDALAMGGVFASPAAQLQSAVDILNQFTTPSE